jgi:glycerophosphoryl diester phosphodiesterase
VDREIDVWDRVRFYSSDRRVTNAIVEKAKWARLFEAREATRSRLLRLMFTGRCVAPPQHGAWTGFDYFWDFKGVELSAPGGEAEFTVEAAQPWTPAAMRCFNSSVGVVTVFFGINSPTDYHEANRLGATAVLTDSPARMGAVRARIDQGEGNRKLDVD